MIDFPKVYEGKTALVTGDLGFKGQHLARWLADLGANVYGFDLARLGHGVQDVRRPDLVETCVWKGHPDFVFHLAAQAFVPVGYVRPRETFEVNALGTVNVLEAVRRHAPEAAVVCVTTDKVYGSTGDMPATEEDPCGDLATLRGRCPYSASKVMAEKAAEAYRTSFGLVVATARAGNVVGGGDWGEGRLVPNAIRALRAERPIPVYNPAAVRPWQYVADVIDGYLRLGAILVTGDLTGHRPGKAFAAPWNFGPDEHHTVEEVVEEVIRAWGSGSWERIERELHEVDELRISSELAREWLDWRPKWHFREMIESTVAWYKEHPEAP